MDNRTLFNKDFTLVVVGQIISLFGNAILRFALPLYLLRETGSAALFGIVTACSFIPVIALSFLGGVLADRVNKRNIMVVLDFITALLILVLYIVLGKLPIVPLFIVTLMLLYGISGTYQPTVQASIPALVCAQNILPASAIINQVSALAGLLGPIIGGVLFGAFGILPILLISIVCFAFSAVLELFIVIPFEKREDKQGAFAIIKSDLRDCAVYIKNEKPILMQVIVLIAIFNLVMSAMMIVGIPILVVDTLQMSDSMLGYAQGMLALGGLVGGIATALLGKKLQLKNASGLLLLAGICVGVMAVPLLLRAPHIVSYVAICAMSFTGMMVCTMFSIQMLATVQLQTDPLLVGKVIAFMMAIAMCAQPIGQALYGFAFDLLKNDTGIILLVSALLSVSLSLVSTKVFKKLA